MVEATALWWGMQPYVAEAAALCGGGVVADLHEEEVAAGLGSGRGKPLVEGEHSTVVGIKRRPDRARCEHGISTSAGVRFEGRSVTCGRCGVLRFEGRSARVVSVGVPGSKGGVVEVTCGRCAGVLRPTSARRSR